LGRGEFDRRGGDRREHLRNCAARARQCAKAFGFDIDPKRVARARENVERNKVSELVTIEQKDIFTLDLSPASVVTLYLLPSLNNRLVPQLESSRRGRASYRTTTASPAPCPWSTS
jgi:hypothetical protein